MFVTASSPRVCKQQRRVAAEGRNAAQTPPMTVDALPLPAPAPFLNLHQLVTFYVSASRLGM